MSAIQIAHDTIAHDVIAEQGYADWAYERLDAMLQSVLDGENAGIDAAAALALWQMRESRAHAIRGALRDSKGLLFGRLDMVDDETWYVGRHAVDGDGGRPAVVDWRASVGGLFYQANRSFPGGVGRRRTIRMAGRSVTGVSDETLIPGFTASARLLVVETPPVPVERLTPHIDDDGADVPVSVEDAAAGSAPAQEPTGAVEIRAADLLLEDLARARTGVLEDVVATIQADQDRLVRAPHDVPLVIQGGPGTGKTIVGLHRAAWVLYQQRQQFMKQSVLVVGPNRRFIEYIGAVLPALGETDVRQATIDELALDSLSSADRSRVQVGAEDRREVAKIKGDARMATVIRTAVWSGIRPKKVSFGYGRFTLRLDGDQVDGLIGTLWQQGVPYRHARRELTGALAQAFADEYVRRLGRRSSGAGPRELKQLMAAARSNLTASGVVAEMLPTVEPRELLRRLYEDPSLLNAAGAVLHSKERSLLHRPPEPGRRRRTWSSSDLPLLDEAAFCIAGESARSGHVVVDEAQDLSPMQWRVLIRRRSSASMTILGDLAQATSPWSPSSWAKVIERAGLTSKAGVAELTLGYRVPRQIMEFAGPILSTAAPGVVPPKSFRSTVDPVVRRAAPATVSRRVAEAAVDGLHRGAVAIIAPVDLHDRIMRCLGEAGHAVALMGPDMSKGLEFDVVVVAEPSDIAGNTKTGLRLLYVVLTRATKELVVVHSRPLPAGVGIQHQVTPPWSYPNPRNDDPWDNDVVHWLLEQPGGEKWTRGVLMECLRRQPNQLARNPGRVSDAARFAKRHGVIQETTERGRQTIIRLYRTDDQAPEYPSSEAARRLR